MPSGFALLTTPKGPLVPQDHSQDPITVSIVLNEALDPKQLAYKLAQARSEIAWKVGHAQFRAADKSSKSGVIDRRAGWAMTGLWLGGAALAAPTGAGIAETLMNWGAQPMGQALAICMVAALAIGKDKIEKGFKGRISAITSTANVLIAGLRQMPPDNHADVAAHAARVAKMDDASAFDRLVSHQIAAHHQGKIGSMKLDAFTQELVPHEMLGAGENRPGHKKINAKSGEIHPDSRDKKPRR